MKTKILIIALDGLEYTYIDQGNYPHIKQQEYGTVKVPVTEIDEASTPIIWSSFVTGEQPEIHGINRSLRALCCCEWWNADRRYGRRPCDSGAHHQ